MKLTLPGKLPSLPAGALPIVEGKKKWLTMAGVALLVTAAITAVMWTSKGNYVALYGSEQHMPVSQIVTVLDGETQIYRIDPDSGQILVPPGDLSKARMLLAGKGITPQGPEGYGLMDKDEMLGASQFVQNVRYKRSLEGELAASIMSLDAVENARVQLAINEDSAFVVSDTPDNSASVVLQLHYGMTLNPEQVNAIVHLVAGSIPGLKENKVSVVDQSGNLLTEDLQGDTQASAATRKHDRILHDIQDKTRESIDNMLASLVGRGNYRVSVMPELDLDNVEETRERYGDKPRLHSEQSSEDNTSDQLALGIPGSLSNRPPAAAAANPPSDSAKGPQSLNSHRESHREYDYDRNVEHIIHPGFEVKHLNVAVVLNREAATVKGWTPAQITDVTTMLNNAAGIDAKRGDTLSVTLMNFTVPAIPPVVKIPWWKDRALFSWSELVGMAVLALMLLLMVIPPLVQQFSRERQKKLDFTLAMAMKEAEEGGSGENGDRKSLNLAFPGDDSLPSPSSGLETKLEFLQKLAISDTDRVAEVVRQWITSNQKVKSDEQ